MVEASRPISPPTPEEYGLAAGEAPAEDGEMIKIGAVALPSSLSPTVNWLVGLSVAVPLSLWSLWGLIERLDSLVLGISIGLLAAIIVFQLAVSVVPMFVDIALYGLRILSDEIASQFSDTARRRIAYRKAWRAYRRELARGGYDDA